MKAVRRSAAPFVVTVAAASLLAACGGGTKTSNPPEVQDPGNPPGHELTEHSNPPPADASAVAPTTDAPATDAK